MIYPLLLLIFLSSCQPSLNHQPKAGPFESSSFFSDGAAARPLPSGVIPYRGGHSLPVQAPVGSRETIRRGYERYGIYCTPCHGGSGAGGLVTQRGFPVPSLLSERSLGLNRAEIASIIRKGKGEMVPMGSRIPPSDIQAIALFLKVLQFSQRAPLASLPEEDRARFRTEGGREGE